MKIMLSVRTYKKKLMNCFQICFVYLKPLERQPVHVFRFHFRVASLVFKFQATCLLSENVFLVVKTDLSYWIFSILKLVIPTQMRFL